MKTKHLLIGMLLFSTGSIMAQSNTFSVSVSQSTDDVEEREDGSSTYLNSSDLELTNDGSRGNQTIGIRFQGVNIPAGAVVTNAYIQFTADGSTSDTTNLVIKGESAQNSITFNAGAQNVSSRNFTTSSVTWNEIPAWTSGSSSTNEQTPNLSAIVSEIISNNDWQSGNAMTFVITGTGERKAAAFDDSAANAPKLIIEYTLLQTFSTQVAQSSDDAEESESGSATYLDSSDLELVFDSFDSQNNQKVGVRFQNVNIPTNATITNAYIQFWVDETTDGNTNLVVHGESAQNSETFTEAANNISARTKTTAQVAWDNIPAWTQTHDGGEDQRTPNLSSVVSEIITSNEWQYGNPMTFIITGSGSRVAEAYDGTTEEAPMLFIEYTAPQSELDLAIDSISGIEDFNYTQDGLEISTIISNQGLNSVSNYSVSYQLNDGEIVSEEISTPLASGATYTHTFAQTLDLTEVGQHSLTVTVNAEGDNVDFNNQIVKEFEVIEQYSDLYFGTDKAWKYLDNGSDMGTAWRNADFDDAEWKIGAGHFGFGDDDEDTMLETGHITYYFRKTVNVENIEEVENIVLNMVADEAAVVYVNGVEVARSLNLPEGEITFSTPATRLSTEDFENTALRFQLDKSDFQTGLNTIAIEIHNRSASNVDVSFSAAVVANPIQYTIDGPYVFYNGDEVIVKNVTVDGPVIETYQNGSVPPLSVNLPNGDSFEVNLAETHEISASTYEMPEKFYVVSDIEGQIDAFTFLLQNAGIIDENYNWIYGDGHLYFLGDLFDRGSYVTQSIWLVYKLEQEARAAGGDVHFIIGNHEVMNFTQDFRYVQPKYFHNAHYVGEMLDDMYEPNTELGRWFRTKNIIERGGDQAIFVHAGISPLVKDLNLSYDEINDYGRIGMDDAYCNNGDEACQIINGGSDEGLYWYRGIAYEELAQTEVDEIVSAFGAEKMLIGHTVFPEVGYIYDEKVVVVDVAHDDNFEDGFMEMLHYNEGCYYRFVADGTENVFTPLNVDCDNLSIEEINLSGIQVSPNPFSNELTIHYPATASSAEILVYDLSGKLIQKSKLSQSSSNHTLQTGNWSNGVYIIKINAGGKIVTQKVIKK